MLLNYLPMDRRHALVQGVPLPDRTVGAVLFADLAGFTALTEALVRALGPQRGADELTAVLERVYGALIETIDHYTGSVVVFGGDALTAWFDGDGGERAIACALAMQRRMDAVEAVPVPGGPGVALGIKTTVAHGSVRRCLVGEPSLQQIEVLAGATMARLAHAAAVTGQGEVVVDGVTGVHLGDALRVQAQRPGLPGEPPCLVVGELCKTVEPKPWPALPPDALQADQLRPWLLPPVYTRLQTGLGEFLADLRTTVSMFVRFGDLDYDTDDAAGDKLDAFVRWVQAVLARYDGWLLTVTIGDKGSTLYITFGAPIAHSDDPVRAVAAALELCHLPPDLAYAGPIHIGMSAGQGWAGAYGGGTRAYSVISDATNLAARLMQAAAPGQILLSANLAASVSRRYTVEPLPDIYVKGKAEPISVATIEGVKAVSDIHLSEPPYTSPLVGRGVELALMETRLSLAQQGHGQIVGVTGEAGMGKSRLVAEIIRRGLAAGLVGYGGEAQSTATQTAYRAWQPVWRAFFKLPPQATLAEQMTTLERELARLDPRLTARLPLLAEALGLPLPDNRLTRQMDGRLRKEAREALLVDCLRAAATPLLLVLEDVQWLDALSADLLTAIGRAITDLPVLLVLVYRPLATWRGAPFPVLALPHVTEVQLTELPPHEAGQLILNQLRATYGPDLTPPASVMDAIARRAEGNPLYIEELLNYLHDRGVVPASLEALDRLALPSSLASLLLSRMDQLTVEQQTTLKVASIIGRVFRVRWLWGVYPSLGPEARVRQDLVDLAHLDLTPLDTPEPDLRYLFKHALTHEVAYDSLPFSQRTQLHGQLAGWLETQPGGEGNLDRLAYHYGRSANTSKQREYFGKAGDAAAARYANSSAIQYYQQLLPLLAPAEQGPPLLALAQVLRHTGAWDEAEGRYQAAYTLAEQTDDVLLRAKAQMGLGAVLYTHGGFDAAEALMDEARGVFVARGAVAEAQQAAIDQATVYWSHGKLAEAQALLEAALAREGADGHKGRRAAIYHLLAILAFSAADYQAVQAWSEQSLALRREIGDRRGIGLSTMNLALVALEAERYTDARALATEGLALFQQIGAGREQGMIREILGLVLTAQGEAAQARPLHRANLALYRGMGVRWDVAASLIGLAAATQADGPPGAHEYALHLVGAADRLQRELSSSLPPAHQKSRQRILVEAGAALNPTHLASAHAAGEAMSWEEAVGYALSFS